MTKQISFREGSEEQYGPRTAGGNLHPNTDLCMDVKTFLLSDRRTKIGKMYTGALTRDTQDHYSFVETLPQAEKRNPHVFVGEFITITLKDDGSLRPNFKPMRKGADFSIDGYAIGVCNELRQAMKGLVEESPYRVMSK